MMLSSPTDVSLPPPMAFTIAGRQYQVEVCPDRLVVNGQRADAMTCGRAIVIAGDCDPEGRLECLFDQLRRLWSKHFGTDPCAAAGFWTDMLRQLNSQGGEPALLAIAATEGSHADRRVPGGWRVELVARWFYSADGLRAAGRIIGLGYVQISSLASRKQQADAICLALRMNAQGGGQ